MILASRFGGSAETKFANRSPVPSKPGRRTNVVGSKSFLNLLGIRHFYRTDLKVFCWSSPCQTGSEKTVVDANQMG